MKTCKTCGHDWCIDAEFVPGGPHPGPDPAEGPEPTEGEFEGPDLDFPDRL